MKREIANYLSRESVESAQTDVPTVWKLSFETDVSEGLNILSHQTCAFCERAGVRLRPFRFRPPAHAMNYGGDENKPCYLWVACNWENLFPICDDCVPKSKNFFPVAGNRADPPDFISTGFDPFRGAGLDLNEKPVFYYPGERKILQGFKIRLDGQLTGNRRAIPTISNYHLNRPELVHLRRQAIETQIHEIFRSSDGYPRANFGLGPDAEFRGSIYLVLYRIGAAFRRRFGVSFSLGLDRIEKTFWRLAQRQDFSKELEHILEELRDQDENLLVRETIRAERIRPRQPIQLDTPRIRSVTLRNFKSLESIDIVFPHTVPRTVSASSQTELGEIPEAPCLMILGENATGKSSILEAIAYTCLPQDLLFKLNPKAQTLLTNPEYMGTPDTGPVLRGQIRVKFDGGLENTLDIDRVQDSVRRSAGDGHPLIFAYGAHRLFGRDVNDDPASHVETLFDHDNQISNPEPWLIDLAKQSSEALNEVVSALRHIIQIDGSFSNIEIRRDAATDQEYCLINIKRLRSDGTTYQVGQRLSVVSSGYRAILAVVCDVFKGLLEASQLNPRAARHANAIVLIDEIEAHLHPRWKMHVVTGLRRALPRATFVFTSHDPLCVRGMYSGEVVMLNRFQNMNLGKTSQMAEIVEQVSDFGNIESLTIEQLLTSELFQLYSTDDRRMDTLFAQVAGILALERDGEPLSLQQSELLNEFRSEIASGLPYGRTEVSRLVQEAVAEYLEHRRNRDRASNERARTKAKEEVKDFLKGLLG